MLKILYTWGKKTPEDLKNFTDLKAQSGHSTIFFWILKEFLMDQRKQQMNQYCHQQRQQAARCTSVLPHMVWSIIPDNFRHSSICEQKELNVHEVIQQKKNKG